MAASLQGTFDLQDRASAKLEKMERRAKATDRAFQKLGRTMDRMGTGKQTASMEKLDKALGRVEKSAYRLERRLDRLGRQHTNINVNTRQLEQAQREVARLQSQLAALEAQSLMTTNATDGLRKKVAGLEAELAATRGAARSAERAAASFFDRMALGGRRLGEKVNPIFGSLGAGLGGIVGGFGQAASSMGMMGKAALALTPILVPLVATITALGGSLAFAVGGAAAGGLGLMSAMSVGLAGIGAVAIPAAKKLSEYRKAVEALNKAQSSGDAKKIQEAQDSLNKVARSAPGIGRLSRALDDLSGRWTKLSRPAQSKFFSVAAGGIRTLNSLMPTFAVASSRAMDAFARFGEIVGRGFRSEGFRDFVHSMSDLFRQLSAPAASLFVSIGRAVANISIAAKPYVIRWFQGMARSMREWSTSMNDAVKGGGGKTKVEAMVSRLMANLGAWKRFIGSIFRLFGALFGGGERSGASLIDRMTGRINKWTEDINKMRADGSLSDWFDKHINQFVEFAKAIGTLIQMLSRLAEQLSAFAPLVSAIVGNPLLSVGGYMAGRGIYRGMGGGAAGGGAAAGQAAAGGRTAAGLAGGGAGMLGRLSDSRLMYQIGRQSGMGRGASMLAGAGELTAGGLRAAGKIAAPVAAAMAAFDFATFPGTAGERTQHTLSKATFGLVPDAQTREQNRATGNAKADAFLQKHGGTGARQQQMAHLQGLLDEKVTVRNPRVRQVLVRPKLTGDARERVEAELKALKPVVRAQVDLQGRERGQGLAGDFQERFFNKGANAAAFENTLGATRGQLGKMGTGSAARELVDQTIAWGRQTAGNNKTMLKDLANFEKAAVKHFGGAERGITVVNGSIRKNTRTAWREIRESMASQARRGVSETSAEWKRLHREALAVLSAMGITGAAASNALKNPSSVNPSSTPSRPGGGPSAPAMPGATTNSPSLSTPFSGGPSGDGLGIGGPTPEDARARVQARTEQMNGGGLMGAKPALGGYAAKAAEFGLRVSSGARAGAVTSSGNRSYHASGDALDLAGSPSQMMSFAQYAAANWGSHLEELIYTPFGKGQIKNGAPFVYGGQVAKDHYDHVHIADTAPSLAGGGPTTSYGAGGGMMPAVNLRSRKSGLPGVTGMLADRASAAVAAALSAKINGAAGAGGGGGGGTMSFDAVARLAESVGLPGVTFAQIAQGESSLNPSAIGNDPGGTQGLGLWQITTGFNDDIIRRFGGRDAMFNPQINAQAAKAIYDRQGIGAWYGTKYMTGTNLHYKGDGLGWGGWHREGGDFTVTKPTLLGVGEAGHEDISITPKGKRPSIGGGGISVTIGQINNHRQGDVKKIIIDELKAVERELAAAGRDD